MQPAVAPATTGNATFALVGGLNLRKLEEAVWLRWRERAEAEKKAARITDADLAAEVSEALGYDVSRATVNHWFRGRREPTVRELIALCAALGADPGHILLNVRIEYKQLPASSELATALREPGKTPDYLSKQAAALRRSTVKARRRKTRVIK